MSSAQKYSVGLANPAFLRGKKVLLIAANFFGLHRLIMDGLKAEGAEVHYFDERPRNNFLTKSLIRLNRNLLAPNINKYYDGIIEATARENYDYVLVIKGECIAANSLRRMRELHPNARFVLYQWDSVSYNPQFYTIRPLFDKVASFDPVDCRELGMDFLPLFYTDDYRRIGEEPYESEYDLLFVGTVHFDRYTLIHDVARQVVEQGGKVKMYEYFQHHLMYYKKRYIDRQLNGGQKDEFQFKSLAYPDLLDLYRKSRIVLDVQKPMQIGQTMRSFEALGSKRKLITTNSDIANYDFYHPDNILIIDRHHPIVPPSFLHSNYTPLPQEIYTSYSLSNWLGSLLG